MAVALEVFDVVELAVSSYVICLRVYQCRLPLRLNCQSSLHILDLFPIRLSLFYSSRLRRLGRRVADHRGQRLVMKGGYDGYCFANFYFWI